MGSQQLLDCFIPLLTARSFSAIEKCSAGSGGYSSGSELCWRVQPCYCKAVGPQKSCGLPSLMELCATMCLLQVAELMFKLASGDIPGLETKAVHAPWVICLLGKAVSQCWEWSNLLEASQSPQECARLAWVWPAPATIPLHPHHSVPQPASAVLCPTLAQRPVCKCWKGACQVMVRTHRQFLQETSLCSGHKHCSPQRHRKGSPPRDAELASSRAHTPWTALAMPRISPPNYTSPCARVSVGQPLPLSFLCSVGMLLPPKLGARARHQQ